MKRYALLATKPDDGNRIEALLPGNYNVLHMAADGRRVIGGTDHAGWTLDGYVLPRLASGLIFGQEISLDDPIMKEVPA
jgi:hypothetical protein